MKSFIKIVSILSFLTFPLPAFAFDFQGSGWLVKEEDGDKKIILFEKDGSFTYLNLISISGNEGRVFSDSRDTWKKNKNKLFISFTDGYKICSVKRSSRFNLFNKISSSRKIMQGSCINKVGKAEKIKLELIN